MKDIFWITQSYSSIKSLLFSLYISENSLINTHLINRHLIDRHRIFLLKLIVIIFSLYHKRIKIFEYIFWNCIMKPKRHVSPLYFCQTYLVVMKGNYIHSYICLYVFKEMRRLGNVWWEWYFGFIISLEERLLNCRCS